jgi:hypothetical protein
MVDKPRTLQNGATVILAQLRGVPAAFVRAVVPLVRGEENVVRREWRLFKDFF